MILKIKLEIIGEVQLNKILERAVELGFTDFTDTQLQKRAAATYLFIGGAVQQRKLKII